MSNEKFDSLCITLCVLSVVVFFGCWIYWGTVGMAHAQAEMMRAVGDESWLLIQQCARDVALCGRE